MASTEARAAALATLPQLGLDSLPAELTRAVVAHDAIMALRPPAPPPGPQTAITAAASQALAAACRKGSTTIVVDPGPVAAARAAETAHRDQAAILAELREAGPLELCRITDRHRAEIVTALQRKHAQIIAELIPGARRLPPGITDQQALDAGGRTRTDFLSTRDLSGQAEALRAVLTDVEDVPLRGEMPGSLEVSLSYVKSTVVYDAPRGHYGPPGTPGFYRALARDVDADGWWLPTRAEQRARAAEIIEERRLDAIADLPRGATVW
jgi:hypothetical protein